MPASAPPSAALPPMIFEPISLDNDETTRNARFALIKLFARGINSQAAIKVRDSGSMFDAVEIQGIADQLRTIFNCDFTIAYDPTMGMYTFTTTAAPQLQDPRVLDHIPASVDDLFLKPGEKYPSATKSPKPGKNLKKPSGAGGKAKIPRPMNCWLVFRDKYYRDTKAKDPSKSVQQISTECAAKWASLTEKEKDFWREEAALKKKAHELMYPDYKFSPRRPGEKKKRQSNKAVKAAKMDVRAAAVALEFSLDPQPAPQLTFDFNDFPGQPLPTAANMTEASLAMPPTFTMDTINAPVPPNPNEDFLTLNVSMPPVYQDSFFAFGTGTDAMGIDNANAFTNSNGATVTHGISTSPVTTNDSPDMAALAAFMDDVNRDIDALDVYGGDGRWHSGHDRAGRGSDMSTIWEFFEDGTGLSDMQSQEYYRQDRLQAELANMFPDFEEQAAFASDTKLANEFNMSDFINE